MEPILGFFTDGTPEVDALFEGLSVLLVGICEIRPIELGNTDGITLPDVIVLPYRKDYIRSNSFRALAESVIRRFGTEDAQDLRTYVVPVDLSEKQFASILTSGADSTLSDLGDVIQIRPGKNAEKLTGEIRQYYASCTADRRKRMLEALLHRFQFYVGSLFTAASVLCVLYSFVACGVNALNFSTEETSAFLGSYSQILRFLPYFTKPYASIIIRCTWFVSWPMLLSVILCVFQQGIRSAQKEYERLICRESDLVLLFAIIGSTVIQSLALTKCVEGHWYLAAPGIPLGFAIDALRRMRFSGIRFLRFKALDKAMSTGTEQKKLPNRLRDSGREPIVAALRKPYLHRDRIKIFVSYTHRSPWACQRVDELLRLCAEVGIDCFVDKTGIPRGASWRRCIFSNLLQADYLIAFVDNVSVEKQWPAAELEMSLAMRAVSGFPNPIAIVPVDFPNRVSYSYLPVFRDTILCSSEPDFFVRTIRYSPLALRTLITKAIAKNEMNVSSSLIPRQYSGKREDKVQAWHGELICRLMRQRLPTKTRRFIMNNMINGAESAKYSGQDADVTDEELLWEYVHNADYAANFLMPKQASAITDATLNLAEHMGRHEVVAQYSQTAISLLYGSLLSDYMSYMKINIYEYSAALAYEKIGETVSAIHHAKMCLQGLEAIENLCEYYLIGFNLDGKRSSFRHGLTVLPLDFSLNFFGFVPAK